MVTQFSLIRTPRILFGEGQIEALPGLLKNLGSNVLIITGSRSYTLYPLVGKTLINLKNAGNTLHFDRIEKEPSPDDVDRIVKRYQPIRLDCVVAVGGGSVIDTGKAVSAMLPMEGSVRDFLEGVGTRSHPGIKKPYIAIPTTSGTGSEATSNAVLSLTGVHGYKRSLRHENFVPDIALVDPLLSLNCPPAITSSSGLDALTQLIESYLSLKSTPFTDALSLQGISQIHSFLVRAVKTNDDIEARSGMSYAALLSGVTLTNAGLGLIHGFAASIGGFFSIPHGVVCGTMMGAVNRHNIETLLRQKTITTTHRKYETLGRLLSGVTGNDMPWYLKFTADYIDNLVNGLQIKHLAEFGITQADLDRIAATTDHKANPVKFEKQQLVEMLKERL
jgi:alcohol dehydrogenase class IV